MESMVSKHISKDAHPPTCRPKKNHTYDNASSHGTSQLPTEHHVPDPVVEDQHPTRSPSANILESSLDSN